MTRINGPLYPFGFGLSYTTFEYSDLKLSATNITECDSLIISFKITNTGKMAGEEIVQLYTRDILSSVTTYEKNLRGFERIHLNPDETKTVHFTIIPEYLELLNAENKWVVEPGDFKIMIGASSEDIKLEDQFTVVNLTSSQRPNTSVNLRKAITVSSNPMSDDAIKIFDNDPSTYWCGEKGNSLTITVSALKRINTLVIYWGENNEVNAEFEIQLSKGGGQFLSFYTGKLYDISESKINVKESGVSDIRIIVKNKKALISKVEIN